ncbi:MAG TPA: DUF3857 domain-containing protein [Candidatus Acidoferrum sp.]
MKATRAFLSAIPVVAALCFLGASAATPRATQDTAQKPAEKAPDKAQDKTSQKAQGKAAPKPTPKLPAEIELLETSVRFEADGSSRKEVHARVKINDELGVRQFARLNFDFNRAFEQVEIPLVRITHPSGGTADVLPSAVTDNPNPAVVKFPAYQDVRVKSVRILGLEPGDSLEYRVVTTTSHHPLAPEFWFEHSFDRTGVVSHEVFELDVPVFRVAHSEYTEKLPTPHINPATAATSIQTLGQGTSAHTTYRWDRRPAGSAGESSQPTDTTEPDVSYSSFGEWEFLSVRLDERLSFADEPLKDSGDYENTRVPSSTLRAVTPEISSKALQLTDGINENRARLVALYDFVSQKIRTVDIPLGSTGFVARPAAEILTSAYATQEDKFTLFAALSSAVKLGAEAGLTGYCNQKGPVKPSGFKRLLISAYDGKSKFWVDPSLEIAPFGLIPPNSGECAFVLQRFFYSMNSTGHEWVKLEAPLPFAAKQRVAIDATLSTDGALSTRAKYVMRGENELLLRTAFHQSPREKWEGVAQLLALSDGFRGKVSKVTASDPYATHDPFTVEYEITQPKFVDWSKKPLRIPALLPLLGLPDPPAPDAAAAPIELGTPLDVEVSAVLHLPAGTTAHIPTGTSVERDFATYSSKYSAKDGTLTATRHLNFILRQIPADRATDYNAFLRTVQNDESQVFTLERADTTPPAGAKPQKP